MTETQVLQKISVQPSNGSLKEEWDRFVDGSRNGTFLHKRGYMDYHSDRFEDHSLMFYANEELTAVLPAHIKGRHLCSHNGLTYGGLILSQATTTEVVLDIFDALLTYMATETGTDTLIYKPTPHIYHSYPCEEDIYALFRNNALLTECKISSAIRLSTPLPIKGRRKMTGAMKARLNIVEDNNFAAFWQVLERRLKERYGVSPVHSLEEIELLHSRFPQNILLFRVTDTTGDTLGGVVMYIAGDVAHTQYIATNDEGRRIGVLDFLYEYLINDRLKEYRFLDFGISVEEGGRYLNNGLISQKERLGGRAVVYNTYEVKIREEKA